MNFITGMKLKTGSVLYPKNNILTCESCNSQIPLYQLRLQIESQTKRPIIFD